MVDFTAMSRGMMERREKDDRKRRELAEAFQLFRQSNPHASLSEMQQYIDATSGGRNYLAGGMPSGEVLQSIANDNLGRKRASEATAALAAMRDKRETQRLMDEEVDRYLLEYDDPDAARQAFLTDYGDKAAGLDLTGAFTDRRVKRLHANLAAQQWDQAERILSATGGDPSSVDLAEQMGVPRGVAEGWVKRFELEESERLEDRKRDLNRQLQLDYDKVISLVERAATTGVDATETIARAYGIDPGLIDPEYVTAIIKDVEEGKARAEEEKKAADAARIFEQREMLVAPLLNNAIVLKAMEAGDIASAVDFIRSRVSQHPDPAVREAFNEEWIVGQLQVQIDALQRQQDEAGAARLQEADVALRDARLAVPQASKTLVAEQEGKFSHALGAAAARGLAAEYAIDDSSLPALLHALNSADDDATDVELLEIGRDALRRVGAPKMSDAISHQQTLIRHQTGAVQADITFDEWAQEARDDVSKMRDKLDGRLQKIAGLPAASQPAELEALLAKAKRGAAQLAEYIRLDELRAPEIITVGTPGFNKSEARKIVEEANAVVAELEQRATMMSDRARVEILVSDAARAIDATEPGVLPNEVNRFNHSYDSVLRQYSRPLDQRGRFGSFAARPTPEQIQIGDFLRDEGFRKLFLENPDAWEQFQADPTGFFENPHPAFAPALRN